MTEGRAPPLRRKNILERGEDMLTNDKKTLCDRCFAKIKPHTSVCPDCAGKHNISASPNSLKEGTVLVGKYAVGKLLGKGGFGMTYLCYDLTSDKLVAIKEFFPQSIAYRTQGKSAVTVSDTQNEEQFGIYVQKFYEEAKLISRFNGNPNIISVNEFFFENNTAYFSMEYLDGYDLKHYINNKGKKIPESEAVFVIDRVIDALLVVHSMGVLHRDISPDNIYMCSDGNVKLIDFGAARQVIGEESKSLSVILKPGFAPLEQYQKRGNQGPWTDIYALGATLYYALTGIVIDDAMSRIDDPTIDMSGISPELSAILQKMLAVRTEDRYQSVFELKTAFSALNIPMTAPVIEKNAEKHSYCLMCGKVMPFGIELCRDCEAQNPDVAAAVMNTRGDKKNTKKQKTAKKTKTEKIKEEKEEKTTKETKPTKKWLPAVCIGIAAAVLFTAIPFLLPKNKHSSGGGSTSHIHYWGEVQYETAHPHNGYRVCTICAASEFVGTTSRTDCETCNPMQEEIHTHTWGEVQYETAHPHNGYRVCTICAASEFVGTTSRTDCETCNPKQEEVHTHTWGEVQYEPHHPHKGYHVCTSCTASEYVGYNGTVSSCTTCYPPVVHTHTWGEVQYEPAHPHKGYHVCTSCTASEYVGYNETSEACTTCNPPTTTYVASGNYGNNITWTLDNEGTLVFDGNGKMYDARGAAGYVISYSISLERVKKVVISDGITNIGESAFRDFSSLTNVEIGSSVKSIEKSAFYQCGALTNIKISNSVTSIGEDAFRYCRSLTSIKIPNSVTNIGDEAFDCCSLTSIEIPNSVTSIGEDAFALCELSEIVVDSGNKYYSSNEYGVLFNKNKTELILFPQRSQLTSYSIPFGVTSIAGSAFQNSSLESIKIPDSVTFVGSAAFGNCNSLISIVIPDSVTSTGDNLFIRCNSLKTAKLGKGITNMRGMFNECVSLTSIELPASITEIAHNTFSDCYSLSKVVVDSKNKYYSSDEYGVLFNKDKTELILFPCSIQLTSYTIPDSVTTIGKWAFDSVTVLKSITIPASVRYVDLNAFREFTSNQTIYIEASKSYVDANWEIGWDSNCEAKIVYNT